MTDIHRGGLISGPMHRLGEIPCQQFRPKIEVVAGEELQPGVAVAISREDGKVYHAVPGKDDGRWFTIPPEATMKDGVLTIPEFRFPL